MITVLILMSIGCASQQVPRSQITFDLGKGTGSLSLPKDAEIEGLDIAVGTNRLVTVKIKKMKVKTNPDVVGASGAATAQVIQASGEVFQKGIEAGIKGAAKTVIP